MAPERGDGSAISASTAPARLVGFQDHSDERGSLTVIEESVDVPFTVQRVYYFGGLPAGAGRGNHAHRLSHTVLVALVGSFQVHVDDGFRRTRHRLDRPDRGLLVPPMNWLRVDDFAPGGLCLVLSSHLHDEDDYYRDYDEFRRIAGCDA